MMYTTNRLVHIISIIKSFNTLELLNVQIKCTYVLGRKFVKVQGRLSTIGTEPGKKVTHKTFLFLNGLYKSLLPILTYDEIN